MVLKQFLLFGQIVSLVSTKANTISNLNMIYTLLEEKNAVKNLAFGEKTLHNVLGGVAYYVNKKLCSHSCWFFGWLDVGK